MIQRLPELPELRASLQLPEALADTLGDFQTGLDLEINAWLTAGGEHCRVFPQGAGGQPKPGAGQLRINAGNGSALEVQVVGHRADSPVLRLLQSSLERAYKLVDSVAACSLELSSRHEEINLLYSISETLGSVLHLDEAASAIVREISRVLGAKRGSLWILSAEEKLLRLAASAGAGGAELRETIPLNDPTSISARAVREGRAILAADNEVAPVDQGVTVAGEDETWLSVPVRYAPDFGEPRIVGVVNLIGRRHPGDFTLRDQRLLQAIANQIGAALENHRLIRESVARERVSREMELAHDLQMKLLPPVPQLPDVEVAARVVSAESVGGDFYQVLRLSGGRVGVMIGDVSGHGFPAALIMALVMSAAAIYAEGGATPASVLERVDRAIGSELESTEMYLSLCYCVLSPGEPIVTYSNAGHPHAFVVPASGAPIRLFATDPPMGIGTPPYGEATVKWVPGNDILLLFTDGLSDTLAQLRRRSGEELILRTTVAEHARPVAHILAKLFEMAGQAIPSIPSDDRTAVVLRTTQS